jgi:hypothetical protein
MENKGQWKRSDEMRVGGILRRQGLKKQQERWSEGRRTVYRKKNVEVGLSAPCQYL